MKTAAIYFCILTFSMLPVTGAVVTVPGDANIFGAGHNFAPNPGGGSGGSLPSVHLLAAEETMLVLSVSGTNTLTVPLGFHGPDGANNRFSQIPSYAGISGITADTAGFLAGVFLGPEEPLDPVPPMLDFSGGKAGFSTLMPMLGQTFFIGDGLTGAGAGNQQVFLVPSGATRLFLGFADANGYIGYPGQYQDNGGELIADVQSFVVDSNTSPPLVFSEPASRLLYEGQEATPFQVQAIGAPPLSYQWLRDGVPVNNADSNALHLPFVRTSDTGNYTAVVTNLHGSATSAPMWLYVDSPAITFLSQPQDVVNMRGASATFFAFASSPVSPLHYQWQFNGVDVPLATNHVLTVANAQNADEGIYRVIVSNQYTSATSAPVSLTLLNHGETWFANLQSIEIEDDDEGFPYPSSIEVSGLFGRITNLTVSILGLEHRWPDDIDMLLVGPGGQSVMLMSDAGGGYGVSDLNLFFTREAIFPIADSGPLLGGKVRPTNYGTNDNLPFPAPSGQRGDDLSVFYGTDPNGTWQLFVRDDEEDGWGRIVGGWRIDFQGDGPPIGPISNTLDWWHPRLSSPSWTPSGATAIPGLFLAVGSSGTILASPQGYEWTSVSSGTTAPLSGVAYGDGTFIAVGVGTILASSNGMSWSHALVAPVDQFNDVVYGNNTFVAVGNSDAVRVSTNAGTSWESAVLGGGHYFEGVAFGMSRFVAVTRHGAICTSSDGLNWVAVPSTNTQGLYSVTHGNGLFVAVGSGTRIFSSSDGTNWTRRFAPPNAGLVTLWDVIYANGTFVCGGDGGVLLTSADGIDWRKRVFALAGAPRISSLAFDGTTVVAVCGNGTNLIFQSDPIEPSPAGIPVPPENATVRIGGTTNLVVTASGTSPFIYQWLREGSPIPGAIGPVLVFSNTQASAVGSYSVVVANALGSATSAPVVLTIGVPPSITVQPLNQEVVAGGTATFSIEVNGTPPFNYRWRNPRSYFTLVTNMGHRFFWTVSNAQITNSGTYGVYVSNEFGFTVSRAAHLTLAADADGDGLPDHWEMAHGLNIDDPSDAFLDSDADGASSMAELTAGTDPQNPRSVLQLSSAVVGSTLELQFEAEPNRTYSLQKADELAAESWLVLREFVARTNRRIETIVEILGRTNCYFRVVAPR